MKNHHHHHHNRRRRRRCSGAPRRLIGLAAAAALQFNLVCDRQWLRSLVSSASLAGMLVSSVTLGVFSDKFGRLRCIQTAYAVSLVANACAIFTRDYFLFCACVLLMSYAQVGAANGLCTLRAPAPNNARPVMEATSPRFRFVPVFEYGVGWALGSMLVPLLSGLTLDYRLLLAATLAWQLLMLPWLQLGVSESIRWLLSEGHFNRAQIELRRACRMNRVRQNGARLAQEIASIQAQQVRKASRLIEMETAPRHLARALGTQVDEAARELDLLSAAIRKSFFGIDDQDQEPGPEQQQDQEQELGTESRDGGVPTMSGASAIPAAAAALSPTLSRMSFCVSGSQLDAQQAPLEQARACPPQARPQPPPSPRAAPKTKARNQLEAIMGQQQEAERRHSFSTQALIQLALKYSKTVQRSDAGKFFLVQMFHRKLWRCTLILAAISIMYETSYYGLLQANKFVGTSVALNYVLGGLGELAAAALSMLMLAGLSRRFSLISTTLVGALVCLAMALSYQLIPDQLQASAAAAAAAATGSPEPAAHLERLNGTQLAQLEQQLEQQLKRQTAPTDADSLLIDNESNLEPISSLNLVLEEMKLNEAAAAPTSPAARSAHSKLLELRDTANFYLMNAGKFAICVGIQVAATIAMEAYPNNLRQSGPGAIVFVGRLGSILAPFLFNDPTPDRRVFKLTLASMSAIGLLVCLFVPLCITDNKDRELSDQLDELERPERKVSAAAAAVS